MATVYLKDSELWWKQKQNTDKEEADHSIVGLANFSKITLDI